MVEFVIFQNNEGEIQRIIAYNTRFSKCATVYDTMSFQYTHAPMVTITSQGVYWTMYKLIQSLYDNVAEKTYQDSMHHLSMSTFRVPHYDELIILEYQSLQGTVCRRDLIHVVGGKDVMEFNRSNLYESELEPMFMFLRKIESISPVNATENLDIMKLL